MSEKEGGKMKQTNCNQCLHFLVCQFINNNNLSEKDWEFMCDNFIIECKQYKDKEKLVTLSQTPVISEKADINKIIKKIEEYIQTELVTSAEGVYK